MRAYDGFTLIELLVVIAIIAILVSILLPSLSAAKELASAATCLSNMRYMAMATVMYADDNCETLPSVGFSHGGHIVDEQGSWLILLNKYSSTPLLYRCKSDRNPHFDTPLPGGRLRKVSYGTNYYVSGQMAGYEKYNRLGSIEHPAGVIFAVELAETGDYAAADHIHADEWLVDVEMYSRQQVAFERHNKAANYAFVDGHAQKHARDETFKIGSGSTPFNINWTANKYDPKVAQ